MINAKPDGNVPFTGARPRFSLLGLNPCWHVHKMTVAANGARPRTASAAAANLDPVVSGGQALWDSLTEGGLFYHLGISRKPVIVEAMSIGGATATIVNEAGAVLRPTPTSFPFRLAPGEFLKCVGGSATERLAILVKLDAGHLGAGL